MNYSKRIYNFDRMSTFPYDACYIKSVRNWSHAAGYPQFPAHLPIARGLKFHSPWSNTKERRRGNREARNGELIPGQWIREIITWLARRRERGTNRDFSFHLLLWIRGTFLSASDKRRRNSEYRGCGRNGPCETRRCLRIQTFTKEQNRGKRLMTHPRRRNIKRKRRSITFFLFICSYFSDIVR